ncbi:hypothetical protein GN958_ATG01237 [Phytophthora infestans]|uniref:Uncharacterized protein n=1 Tax=Phytophthora infestans TaxID=4787 RepID=A0A8S9VDY6_PHYIN|nr:hypothetical protein GN958_ATG01237 [Phytophthora infestans]
MDKLVSAASTARRTGCMRCVGCQGGKAHRRDELFQGKFQIKADCVDDLDSSYACSNVAALRFPTAMCNLVSAASTARRSGGVRSVSCQGGKAPISDGYGVARERGGDGKADSSWAQPISDGYGQPRERGVDCKADSSWAQRRLPRRKARERDKRFQGKFQIKADRVEVLDSGYACSNVTALRFPYGYGGSSLPTVLVSKLFQGKFQIKADRGDDLDSGYACGNVTALRFPTAMGNLVSAASTAGRSGCVRSVGFQGRKARRRDKLFQGKFQIKADRVDDLDSSYACSNVTALRFPTAMGNLVSAASTARRSGCVRSVGCQGGKPPISYGYGQPRERGIDCKAVRLCAQRRVPRRKSTKFQIKADRVDDLTPAMRAAMLRWHSDFHGYGETRERGIDCKAVRLCAASGSKAENHTGATSAVAGSKDRANGLLDDSTGPPISYGYGQPRKRGIDYKAKLFQGKFQIKADRVEDCAPAMRAAMLQHSYITNQQIIDLLPLIALSYGYGEARERGIDCKAVRLCAQRRVPRQKST